MKITEKELIAQIKRNAEILQELHSQVNQSYKNKSQDPQAYKTATRTFHEQYDKLVFPGGNKELSRVLEQLQAGDSSSLDRVIAYLKANPYFHRSGYIKEKLLNLIKRLDLTKKEKYKLQDIALDAIAHTAVSREFTYYCKLVPFITDEEFYAKIQDISEQSDDPKIKKRAQRMLDAIEK